MLIKFLGQASIPNVTVSALTFPLSLRLLRIAATLLCKYGETPLLMKENEKILAILLHSLSGSGGGGGGGGGGEAIAPEVSDRDVHMLLTLEVLHQVCECPLMLRVFYRYGTQGKESKVFTMMVEALAEHIVQHAEATPLLGGKIMTSGSGGQRASRVLDMLNSTAAPVDMIQASSPLRISVQCLVNIVHTLDKLAEELFSYAQGENQTSARAELKGMVTASWECCLKALAELLQHSDEEDVIQFVLKAYQSFTNTCGLLGLVKPRDEFIHSLCKFSLPMHSANFHPKQLQAKHIQALKTMFNIAHCLGGILGSAWHVVLKTVTDLDQVMQLAGVKASSSSASSYAPQHQGMAIDGVDRDELMILASAMQLLFETTCNLDDAAVHHVILALGDLSLGSLAATSSSGDDRGLLGTGSPSFALFKLVETAKFNRHRIVTGQLWDLTAGHLNLVANNREKSMRNFGPEWLTQLIIAAMTYVHVEGESKPDSVRGSRESSQGMSKLGMSSPVKEKRDYPLPSSEQVMLLTPLEQFISSPYPDTRENTLRGFQTLLESCGHLFKEGWSIVLSTLRSVAVAATPDGSSEVGSKVQVHHAAVTLAFKSVQLIVDDFLASLSISDLMACLTCVGSFGSQVADVNISLTAVGKLWSLADHIAQVAPKNSPDQAEQGIELWSALFAELRHLCVDPRAEARNCALRTLTSTIVTHGNSFANQDQGWDLCLRRSLFPLLAAVQAAAGEAVAAELAAGGVAAHEKAGIRLHHSRDTADKQWNETRVLVLDEVSRVTRSFFKTVRVYPWFKVLWDELVERTMTGILEGTRRKEVSVGAIKSLQLLIELVSEGGPRKFEVRAAVGMKVIDGALQYGNEKDRKIGAAADKDESESALWVQQKAVMWNQCFSSYERCAEMEEDCEGDVTTKLLESLATVYNDSRDVEFASKDNCLRLFKLVDLLIVEKPWPEGKNAPKFKPSVSSVQRASLALFKSLPPFAAEAQEVWKPFIHQVAICTDFHNIVFTPLLPSS